LHHSSTFFLINTTTTHLSPLSLHDALPISHQRRRDGFDGAEISNLRAPPRILLPRCRHGWPHLYARVWLPRRARTGFGRKAWPRSEEHTSELQSLAYLVCRLLLEKKKKVIT